MRYSSLWSKRQRNWADSPEMGDKALLRYAVAQEREAASPVHRNLSKSSELWRQYEKYAAQSLKNVIPITKNFGTTNWWERVIFPLISIHHTLHVQVYYCLAKKQNKRGLIHHQMMILLAFQVWRYITTTTSRVATEGVRLSVDSGLGWAKPARSDDIWMEVGTLALF